MRIGTFLMAAGIWMISFAPAEAASIRVFYADFDAADVYASGVGGGFSGIVTEEPVQGFAGLGTGSNVFAGEFLRNTTGGNPADKTILTLTNLPEHTSVEVNFLLALIDTWDGDSLDDGPDVMRVNVRGWARLRNTFSNNDLSDMNYVAPAGVMLSWGSDLGFISHAPPFSNDSAWDMGLEPNLDNVPHTGDQLVVEWLARGPNWTGGAESWAIDNVEVILHGAVPEPSLEALLGMGLLGLAALSLRGSP